VTEQEIIDLIFSTRVRNNLPWRKLLEIALRHAPDETRIVLREITANDKVVSTLMHELAK
jgi:hypothetical protein